MNLTYVKVTDTIIYPGITWDSFLAVLIVILGYVVSIGLWYLLAWCTEKKLTKLLRKSGTQRPDLLDEI